MKLNQFSKMVVVAVAVVGLAACSHKKTSSEEGMSSTQPIGMDNQFQFMTDSSLTREQLLAINTFYFKFDRTDLLGVNLQAVQAHGQDLSTNPNQRVLLKGYTDIQGSREYNIGLGYRRSQSVAFELMAQGTNKNQIEMVSYGPEFPADPDNTQEAYQKNRRVEFVKCDGASCQSVYGNRGLKGVVR